MNRIVSLIKVLTIILMINKIILIKDNKNNFHIKSKCNIEVRNIIVVLKYSKVKTVKS